MSYRHVDRIFSSCGMLTAKHNNKKAYCFF